MVIFSKLLASLEKTSFTTCLTPKKKKCLTPTQSALLGGNGWFERNAKEALQQIIFIGWDDWDWDVALTISGSQQTSLKTYTLAQVQQKADQMASLISMQWQEPVCIIW